MGNLRRPFACLALAAAIIAGGVSQAAAESAVGVVEGTNLLVVVDTASPGTFKSMKRVTGLGLGERLVGVDFRHHPHGETVPLPPPQLFGLGLVELGPNDSYRIYTIDPATAVATPVGPGFVVPASSDEFGMDFAPTADRIRLVNKADQNLRVNPNNGALVQFDTSLSTANLVSGVAYDRVEIPIPPSVSTNTTAYAISLGYGSLVTIGGIDSTPSPNGGSIMNTKSLGIALAPSSSSGFDISPTGAAYAALVEGTTGVPGLYSVNLGTGAATLIGSLPEALSGFAIVPDLPADPPPAPTPTLDQRAPGILLKGLPGSLSLIAFKKGFPVKAEPDEPAALGVELLAAPKSARLASFNLILASASSGLAAGERTLRLKPSGRLVGKPTKPFRVSLRVTATDAAKNASTVTKTIRVKPAKKKKKPKR